MTHHAKRAPFVVVFYSPFHSERLGYGWPFARVACDDDDIPATGVSGQLHIGGRCFGYLREHADALGARRGSTTDSK
jgi:hypothetical protein